MFASLPLLLLLLLPATHVLAQSDSSSTFPQQVELPGDGADQAPFPNSTYLGAESPDPAAQADAGFSPPYYPSPWATGTGVWASAYAKAKALVAQMTLLEKVNVTTGVGWQSERCVGQTGAVPRLGFRSLCLQDSPTGVRDTDYNSLFPAGVNVAATWNTQLAYARGQAMGAEHRDKGVDVMLGPVAGPLGRAAEGGRGWEGFSPDPVLTGQLFAQSIAGIQSSGVVACGKHFILNEQEHFRQVSEALLYENATIAGSLSSNVDDRTMHELYLWPFADGVKAGLGSIMCAYVQVNNSYSCQNSYILNYLLKSELDFQGFVMSDWGAQQSGVSAALAGMDMAMPGDVAFNTGTSFWGANLTIAVLNGTVPTWRIDDMATRIIAAYYLVGRDSNSTAINFDSWTFDTFGYEHFYAQTGYGLINEHVNVRGEHAQVIRQIGAESSVLLKNVNNTLPLTGKEKFTAVFGEDAGGNAYGPNGCSDRGCDNGTLGIGWGSGTANYPYLVTPSFAIESEVLSNGGVYQAVTDNYASMQVQLLAPQASVALVFVNSDSGEGYIDVDGNQGDRNNLTLWKSGDDLITQVSSLCNNTIVVVHSTGPVLLANYSSNPNITAMIWAGAPGQESGNAIADVLYGRVNPSGKLPFSLANTREDYGTDVLYKPNNGQGAPQQNFTEGLLIDYRSIDARNITPLYEFGYGLSYTNFSYSALQITPVASNTAPTPGPVAASNVAAPSANSSQATDASHDQFPANFTAVEAYIYPYLNSTNLTVASNDSQYGNSSFVPPGATTPVLPSAPPASGAPGGNPGLWDVLYTVSATVTNNGTLPGQEVVQLYIALNGAYDPPKILRSFAKLSIGAGGSAKFEASLTRRDLSRWNTTVQNWMLPDDLAAVQVYVGGSSRVLPLSGNLTGVAVS